MTITENFGKQLRELRKKSGLSQMALAEKSGYSTSTISRAESGNVRRLSELEDMVEALGAKISIRIDLDHANSSPNDISDELINLLSDKVMAKISKKLSNN